MSRSPARLGLVALTTGAVLAASFPARCSPRSRPGTTRWCPGERRRHRPRRHPARRGDRHRRRCGGRRPGRHPRRRRRRGDLTGAHVDTLIVAGGSADVDATSVVQTVRTFDSVYHAAPGATVGSHDTFQPELFAAALAPLAIALWLGFALAYLVAGLAVAAIGGPALRQAGASLTGEPAAVLLAAVGLLVGLPVLFGLLMITVVGIPVGLAGLLVVLPMLWFREMDCRGRGPYGNWVLFQPARPNRGVASARRCDDRAGRDRHRERHPGRRLPGRPRRGRRSVPRRLARGLRWWRTQDDVDSAGRCRSAA